MKRVMWILLLLFSIPAFGQQHLIGVKGGVSTTNARNFFSNNLDVRQEWMGGVTYTYRTNQNFQLGVGFLYYQKGFKLGGIYTTDTGEYDGAMPIISFNYDYVSFPVKVGYTFGKQLIGFVNVGIVPSILVKGKLIQPDDHRFGIKGFNNDLTSQVTPFDMGGLIEIGGDYKLSQRVMVSVALDYQHSLIPFTNEDYFSYLDAVHHGLTLSLGGKYVLK